MAKYYTGVGSRETPQPIMELMADLAAKLAKEGWTLRSGGAEGADTAFENGWWQHRMSLDACYTANDYECYIAWAGFNGHEISSHAGCNIIPSGALSLEADRIASTIHPAWDVIRKDGKPALSKAAKKLHSRNIFQVLGKELNNPSKFLVCYAEVDKDGIPKGGTRTAWQAAKLYDVECFNLFLEKDRRRIEEWI